MTYSSAREILEAVAAGELEPAEASRLLDELAGPDGEAVADGEAEAEAAVADPTAAVVAPAATGPAAPPMVPEITRVLVRATSRRVRIIGDPTVATASVDGQHTVRRDVSTLVIAGEAEMVPTDDAFVLIAGGQWREVADRVQRGLARDLQLTVRVRPDLPVGVEVIAGSVQVEGARALDHVRVTAGSLRVSGSEEPIDVLVQAGSAQIETRQVHGKSRVRCESGSLQMTLGAGSDVRIRSDVQLGRFVTEPERRGRDRTRDVVVGTGAAELDVEVVMGSATVKLPTTDGAA